MLDVQVRRNATPLRVAERDVNHIVVERTDPRWNGSLIGFGVGAGSGLLIELGGRTQYQKFSGGTAIALGIVGGLTGLLIDVLNQEHVSVCVRPPATAPASAPR